MVDSLSITPERTLVPGLACLAALENDADAWWSALYEKSSGIYQRR